LWAHDIAHRISEKSAQQIVWVATESDVEVVRNAYHQFQNGTLVEPEQQPPQYVQENGESQLRLAQQDAFNLAMRRLREVPFVTVMILISIVVTALLNTGIGHGVFELLRMGTLGFIFESWELWRLITPVFLHFDIMHLVFNMVLLWVFGRQLELHEKRITLLMLLLVFAVIPNVTQNLLVGIRFGGMSGVVYAVLGYCWLSNRIGSRAVFAFPNAMMGLMVGWMLLGFTDILTWIGLPAMANMAHLGGLVAGLACAWAMVKLKKMQRN
jgi:GlpG protein